MHSGHIRGGCLILSLLLTLNIFFYTETSQNISENFYGENLYFTLLFLIDWISLGDCEAGFICTGGATASIPTPGVAWGGACSPGHYCPRGTPIEEPCPPGTYRSVKNLLKFLIN